MSSTSVLHRNLRHPPPTAVRGDGIRLTLSDGRSVIDASGGAAVSCLGHGNARVIEAAQRQMARLAYCHTSFFTSEPAEALAELLIGVEPRVFSHALFLTSGSEAMEAALKIARQYHVERDEPQRRHFIGRRQSYHGSTLATLAVGGHLSRRNFYEPMLPLSFSHVTTCFPYHYKLPEETDEAYVLRLENELEEEFLRVGPQTVAAFCVEPVIGATAGCVAALPGYLAAVRRVCDRHGALLIFDEVMCGAGRTGTFHAWEQDDVSPDIQSIAKGLGGGYQPISAVLIESRVAQAIGFGGGSLEHGQTYQAHPVACAAALEVQRIVQEESLLENVRKAGELLGSELHRHFDGHPNMGDVRGRGLFWALEFVREKATKAPFPSGAGISGAIKDNALAGGLAAYSSSGTVDGHAGDHVIIAPAFTVNASEIAEIVDRLSRAVAATFHSVRKASNMSMFLSMMVWFLASQAADSAADNDSRAERVRRFETGLRPAFVGADGERSRWTIEERMEHWKVPAVSVAVVKNGKLDWVRAYGVRQAGSDIRVDADTVFSVGSLSKVAAAAVSLRLVEAGKIELDRDISEYLTSWSLPRGDFRGRPVTLRGILSHTAGINVSGFRNFQPNDSIPTLIEVLDGRAPAISPPVAVTFEPGSVFSYSGGGTTVQELMLEDVTGLTFPEAARLHVFEPLEMTRSTFENPLPAGHGNIAFAHDQEGNPAALPRGWETMPQRAASGLWTTSADYARLIVALMQSYNGQSEGFIGMGMAREMMTEVGPGEYGLGPAMSGKGKCRRFSHAGGNDSYRAWMEGYLAEGQGMVILANARGALNLIREIRRSIADAEGFCRTLVDETVPVNLSVAELEKFVGTYSSMKPTTTLSARVRERRDLYRVTRLGNVLYLDLLPGDIDTVSEEGKIRLHPIGTTTFAFDETLPGSKELKYLEFIRDYDATISGVIVRIGDYALEAQRFPTGEE